MTEMTDEQLNREAAEALGIAKRLWPYWTPCTNREQADLLLDEINNMGVLKRYFVSFLSRLLDFGDDIEAAEVRWIYIRATPRQITEAAVAALKERKNE